MSQDYKSILQGFKEEMAVDYLDVDTMAIIEEVNPKLTKDSRKYKDSNKVIFKQSISDLSAEVLVKLVNKTDGYDLSNLMEYKSEILSKCRLLNDIGENPIEMLVYATKGLYGKDIFINSIRDLTKNIYEKNQENVRVAYSSILTNWNWNDCLEFVLKSIIELRICELADEVYCVFEKNKINRGLAATTLSAIGASNHYESMINYLCAQPNETREEVELLRRTLYNFAKQDDSNSEYIYKCYLKLAFRNDIKNILVGAIRINLSKAILDHIEKNLKNSQISTMVTNKMLRLLGQCKTGNAKAIEILTVALKYNHLDRNEVNRAIGNEDAALQESIIKDKSKSTRDRITALVSVGKSQSENIEEILVKVSQESEQLNAVACSIWVERGDINQLIQLFRYVVGQDDQQVVIEATNQVKRLRGLKDPKINEHLMKVAETVLNTDDSNNINRVMKILDIFSSGIPTEEIGELFLKKLNTTNHAMVKNNILSFYKKEYNRFSKNLKLNIKDIVVNCTQEKDVAQEAMKCLKAINSFVDLTPSGGVSL